MSGLNYVIKQFQNKRDLSFKFYQSKKRELDFAINQLEELNIYIKEIKNKLNLNDKLDSLILKQKANFLAKLEESINLQNKTINYYQQQLKFIQKDLIITEQKLLGLENILKNRQINLKKIKEKQEQKNTNELATLKFIYNK